jgi:HD-GYP domain-containing protein (c-di-GMP phosphodiesterase class II)
MDCAANLGAEAFVAPFDYTAICAAVRRASIEAVEASWSALSPAETQALTASADSFKSCFLATARGEKMPLAGVYSACDSIQDSFGVSNVGRWLDSLRQHHDSTFRHSMFVCGSLSHFANAIGINGVDLKELTLGGFLHDAGKARVPLEILDKPGKLNDAEWAEMRNHAAYSREILLAENDLSPQIVEMAVHHHERLDGTGYPDGLKGAQNTDAVRLTAIADVFSALVEPRAYKEEITPEKALDMMASFDGHLDPALLKSFREFMLDNKSLAA